MTRRFFLTFIILAPSLLLFAPDWVSTAGAQKPIQFKLRTLAGSDFSLSDQRGKVVVLSFSSARFPLASQTIPALQQLADHYEGRNVEVYWVSIDGTQPSAKGYVSDADLKAFVERNGGRFVVLRDPDKMAFNSLGLDVFPTVVVIGRQGELLRTYVGFDAESKRGYRDLMETIDLR